MTPTPTLLAPPHAEAAEVRATLDALATKALGRTLPEGDLSSHFDSVQLLTLVVAVEDHFGIVIEPEDEDGVRTVADVVDVVLAKTRRGGA